MITIVLGVPGRGQKLLLSCPLYADEEVMWHNNLQVLPAWLGLWLTCVDNTRDFLR